VKDLGAMNKRPLAVTLIAILFFVAGVMAIVYHATELSPHHPFRPEPVWALGVRLLAIVGAIFLFRAQNWARWLLVFWMAFHVVLSSFHSVSKLLVHGLLLALIAYLLFRPSTSIYFQEDPRAEV
jgi:hypothetical protein